MRRMKRASPPTSLRVRDVPATGDRHQYGTGDRDLRARPRAPRQEDALDEEDIAADGKARRGEPHFPSSISSQTKPILFPSSVPTRT
jgi:hypothetical protein